MTDTDPTEISVKPYTKYRCANPDCGKSSLYTGALHVRRPNDGICLACGVPMVEVIEDGHTYRVAWEAVGPYDPEDGWHPVHKDHTDRVEAEDQYRTLAEWERTGVEKVRAVTITRSVTSFEPYGEAEDEAPVHVAIYANDEGRWVELCEPGDRLDDDGWFEADIPADLFATFEHGHKAGGEALSRILDHAGIDPETGAKYEACDEWVGTMTQERTVYSVQLIAGEHPDAPRAHIRAHGFDSAGAAEAWRQALPDEVHLLVLSYGVSSPGETGDVIVTVRREDTVVVSEKVEPRYHRCRRCFNDHDDHGPLTTNDGPPTAEVSS